MMKTALTIFLLLGTATSAAAQNQSVESKEARVQSLMAGETQNDSVNSLEAPAPTKPDASKSMSVLKASAQAHKELAAGVLYFNVSLPSGARAHVVALDRNNNSVCLRPYANKSVAYISSSAIKCKGLGAINGGFFNMKDGASISYVTVDGAIVCNPSENRALKANSGISRFLPQILNREEFRVLTHEAGGTTFSIDPHDAPPPPGWKILHALQAGPMLLPKYTAREGAFVRTNSNGTETDSIDTSRRRARTAIGIASDAIIIICVEGPQNKRGGATLPDLIKFFKSVGCYQALNCDGGSSTTMVIKDWNEFAITLKSAAEVGPTIKRDEELQVLEDKKLDDESQALGDELLYDEQDPCGDIGPVFKIRGIEARYRGNEGGLGVVYSHSPERPVKSTLVIAPSP